MYHEIRLNALTYLGFHDLRDVDRMTLAEYQLRMESYQLKTLNRQEEMAIQAWLNQSVQATTEGKHPRPKFKRFKDFFDRKRKEERIRERFEDPYRNDQTSNYDGDPYTVFAKRYEEFNRLKAAGRIDPNAWKNQKEVN